jgi:Ni,Fe-hydrogenase I large subunit
LLIFGTQLAKANVQQWSMQQLMFWLESNKMKWLKPIYKEGDDSVKKYIREDTKMFQKRQDKNNEVLLKGGPAENMIAFTTLPEDATLRVIWSEGDDYLADFLMTFYGFSTPRAVLGGAQVALHICGQG